MGATQTTGTNRIWFKMKQDKRDDSKSKGELRFFKKDKVNGEWVETEDYSRVTGHLEGVEVRSFQFEGEEKKELQFTFRDDDPNGKPFGVHMGLDSMVAKNILNSIAGIEDLGGVLSLSAGRPREYQGKWYPTLYVNIDNQKTNWKYDKAQIPQITTEKIEGQSVKRGVLANLAFWEGVVTEISMRLRELYPQGPAPAQQGGQQSGGIDFAKKAEENRQRRGDYGNAYGPGSGAATGGNTTRQDMDAVHGQPNRNWGNQNFNPSPDTTDDLPF